MTNSGINLRYFSNKAGARGEIYMLTHLSSNDWEGVHPPDNSIAQLYYQQVLGINLRNDAFPPNIS